jgi:hypothetical protein
LAIFRKQINIQKSAAFLYTNNTQTQKKIREFITASKTIKYFRINLTKETKDLFNEDYKPLRAKLKKTLDDVKNFHACGSVESTL